MSFPGGSAFGNRLSSSSAQGKSVYPSAWGLTSDFILENKILWGTYMFVRASAAKFFFFYFRNIFKFQTFSSFPFPRDKNLFMELWGFWRSVSMPLFSFWWGVGSLLCGLKTLEWLQGTVRQKTVLVEFFRAAEGQGPWGPGHTIGW